MENYANLWNRLWVPLMRSAGLARIEKDKNGVESAVPFFTPHTLRHVGISLWIESGVKPKRVQKCAGHSSIKTTMDIYGHLWDDDQADAAASERSILG